MTRRGILVLGLYAVAREGMALAVGRPYILTLGMSSVALLVSLVVAFYVYFTVHRARKRAGRATAAETVAAELDRRSVT